MQQSSSESMLYMTSKKENPHNYSLNCNDSNQDFFKVSAHGTNSMTSSKVGAQNNKRYNRNQRMKSAYSRSTKNQLFISRTKLQNQLPKVTLQFNDVKWLKIISAYDPKRLSHVTVKQQSYVNSVKHYQNEKSDQNYRSQYKVIQQNFNSWKNRINLDYFNVLDNFLNKQQHSSMIVHFFLIKPLLIQVKDNTKMIKEKVQSCLNVNSWNKDFIKLLQKFKCFLEKSIEIQRIIQSINKSKGKIDSLLGQLDREQNIVDQIPNKIQKYRIKGIKKVKKIIQQYPQSDFDQQIMRKAQIALEQIANKNLQVYSNLKGAKSIFIRIRDIISSQQNGGVSIGRIKTMVKIFSQVLKQAEEFDFFAENFLENNDMANDDLKNCIRKYQNELDCNRKSVYELQSKFINLLIQSIFEMLKFRASVINALGKIQQDQKQFGSGYVNRQFIEANNLLNQIAENIYDEKIKVILQKLVKQSKSCYLRLQQQLQKIKGLLQEQKNRRRILNLDIKTKTPVLVLDDEQSLQIIQRLKLVMKQYKQRIKIIIRKQQDAYAKLNNFMLKLERFELKQDIQINYIEKVIKLGRYIQQNYHKQKINNCILFQKIKQYNINKIGIESLQNTNKKTQNNEVFIELIKMNNERIQLSRKNQIKQLIGEQIILKNQLYQSAELMKKIYQKSIEVKHDNIILDINHIVSQLNTFLENSKGSIQKMSFSLRIICISLLKGFTSQDFNNFTNYSSIRLPENQYQFNQLKSKTKLYQLVLNQIYKNKKFMGITDVIKFSLNHIQKILQHYEIYQQIKNNINGKYYIDIKQIQIFIRSIFDVVFILENQKSKKLEKLIKQLIEKLQVKIQYCNTTFKKIKQEIVINELKNIKNINQKFQNKIKNKLQEFKSFSIKSSQLINIYSQIILQTVIYLQQTKQIYFAILTSKYQPIWVGCISNSSKPIGQEIALKFITRGNIINNFKIKNQQSQKDIPQSNSKKSQQSTSNKNKKIQQKKINRSLNQQIDEQKQDLFIQDNIQDFCEQQNKDSQIIEQKYSYQQIQDGIQQIVEQDYIKKQQVQEFPEQIQQQQANLEKKINPNQTFHQTIYQSITIIESLEDLHQLINFLMKLYTTFISKLKFHNLLQYFNNSISQQGNYIDSLSTNFNKLVSQVGRLQYLSKSEQYIYVCKCISELKMKNWNLLSSILQEQQIQYSILGYTEQKNNQNQIKWIWIRINDQKGNKCIQQYFKQIIIEPYSFQFQIQDFLIDCCQVITQKNSKFQNIKILLKNITGKNIWTKNEINIQIQKFQQIIRQSEGFLDNLQLENFVIQLWNKVTFNYQQQNQYIINMDYSKFELWLNNLSKIVVRKILKRGQKPLLLNYIKSITNQSKKEIKLINQRKNVLENIIFRANSQTILQCIQELQKIYCKKQIFKIVYEDQHTLIPILIGLNDFNNNVLTKNYFIDLCKQVKLKLEESFSYKFNSQDLFKALNIKPYQQIKPNELQMIKRFFSILKINFCQFKNKIAQQKYKYIYGRNEYNVIEQVLKQNQIEYNQINIQKIINQIFIVSDEGQFGKLLKLNQVSSNFFNKENYIKQLQQFYFFQKQYKTNQKQIVQQYGNIKVNLCQIVWNLQYNEAIQFPKFTLYEKKIQELYNNIKSIYNKKSLIKYYEDIVAKITNFQNLIQNQLNIVQNIKNKNITIFQRIQNVRKLYVFLYQSLQPVLAYDSNQYYIQAMQNQQKQLIYLSNQNNGKIQILKPIINNIFISYQQLQFQEILKQFITKINWQVTQKPNTQYYIINLNFIQFLTKLSQQKQLILQQSKSIEKFLNIFNQKHFNSFIQQNSLQSIKQQILKRWKSQIHTFKLYKSLKQTNIKKIISKIYNINQNQQQLLIEKQKLIIKLQKLNIENTDYEQFIIFFFDTTKILSIPINTIISKQQQIICFTPLLSSQKLEDYLINLRLPTQYEPLVGRPNVLKLISDQCTFLLKDITQDDMQYIIREKYGEYYKKTQNYNQYKLAIYLINDNIEKNDDEILVSFTDLQRQIKVKITANYQKVTNNFKAYIVKGTNLTDSQGKFNSQSILEIVTDDYQKAQQIGIGDIFEMKKIDKWVKQLIKSIQQQQSQRQQLNQIKKYLDVLYKAIDQKKIHSSSNIKSLSKLPQSLQQIKSMKLLSQQISNDNNLNIQNQFILNKTKQVIKQIQSSLSIKENQVFHQVSSTYIKNLISNLLKKQSIEEQIYKKAFQKYKASLDQQKQKNIKNIEQPINIIEENSNKLIKYQRKSVNVLDRFSQNSINLANRIAIRYQINNIALQELRKYIQIQLNQLSPDDKEIINL